MQPERVDEMLSKYKLCKGKSKHLQIEIAMTEKNIRHLRANAIDDAASLSGVDYNGMPHAQGVSDPTGRIAIRFADGFTPTYIIEEEASLSSLKEEKEATDMVIAFVESWLGNLNERERYVVEKKVCDGHTWRTVMDGFYELYGTAYSREGIKGIMHRALEKIYRIAA